MEADEMGPMPLGGAGGRMRQRGGTVAGFAVLSRMGQQSTSDLPRTWIVIARVALFLFACAVCLAAAAPWVKNVASPWKELLLGAILSALAFVLTAVFVRWDRKPFALGLAEVGAWSPPGERRGAAARFGVGFGLGLALVAITTAAMGVFGGARFELAKDARFVEWGAALLGYVLLSSREELAFRGYPLFRLRAVLGDWPALIIVALIFAAEHRLGGWDWGRAMYGAGVGSLVFGMAALATRGLALPIGIHAAWNFGQWAVGLRGDGAPLKATVLPADQAHFDLVHSMSYVIVMVGAGVGIWVWKTRARRRGGVVG